MNGGGAHRAVSVSVDTFYRVCLTDKGPHRSSSPLDPLLAGLLSVFIVTTAVIFIVLFLRFRQRTNHPEFHRLQDLPMVRCKEMFQDTPTAGAGVLTRNFVY